MPEKNLRGLGQSAPTTLRVADTYKRGKVQKCQW
jgi:hypothetical protein